MIPFKEKDERWVRLSTWAGIVPAVLLTVGTVGYGVAPSSSNAAASIVAPSSPLGPGVPHTTGGFDGYQYRYRIALNGAISTESNYTVNGQTSDAFPGRTSRVAQVILTNSTSQQEPGFISSYRAAPYVGSPSVAPGRSPHPTRGNGTLVYVTYSSKEITVGEMNPDGSNAHPLAIPFPRGPQAVAGFGPTPSLSPEGTQLLLGGDTGLTVAAANGSGGKSIWSSPHAVVSAAAWSPSGDKIAFAATDTSAAPGPPRSKLYIINSDGTGLRAVTSGINIHDVAWSPDGARLAFLQNQAEIWVVGSDGGPVQMLYGPAQGEPPNGLESSLSWAPNEALLFGLLTGLGVGVWTYRPPQSHGTMILRGADSPSWSPDGTRYAAVLHGRVVVGSVGSSARNVIGPSGVVGVQWGGTAVLTGLAWTKDPVPVGVINAMGVACSSPSHCFAFAQGSGGGMLLNSVNGGRSWSTSRAKVPLYNLDPTCPTRSRCYALTTIDNRAAFLRSDNGGRSWVSKAGGSMTSGFLSLACPTTAECVTVGFSPTVAVGAIGAYLEVTRDGGDHWASGNLPHGVTRKAVGLTSNACATGSDCIAPEYRRARALVTTDGGSSWSVVVMPGPAGSIVCPTVKLCVAISSNSSRAYVTTDAWSGWRWRQTDLPGATANTGHEFSYNVSAIACPTAEGCVAIFSGLTNGLWTTTDGGAKWNSAIGPTKAFGFSDVACAGSQACVAVGAVSSSGGSAPAVIFTGALIASGTVLGHGSTAQRFGAALGPMMARADLLSGALAIVLFRRSPSRSVPKEG